MFIRSPYNYDRDEASLSSGLQCLDKSKAVQSQKDEADINNIVKQFGLTGKLPMNTRTPQYGDYTGVRDYQTALNQVIEAEQAFMQLPPEIRKRFHNDPQELLEFVSMDSNREEAISLGLIPKKPLNEPTGSAGVPPSDPAGKPEKAKKATPEKTES